MATYTQTYTNGHFGETVLRNTPFPKISTNDTDSNDQLCTGDYCIQNSKRKTGNNANTCSGSPVSRQKNANCSTAQKQQTARRLCKSCGGEMKTEPLPKLQIKESSFRLFVKQLTNILPDWLVEPEFFVYPKPRNNKDAIHHHADSLFSTSSGFTNYYGILNLCLILLVLGFARLFLENIIKYGILINLSFTQWFFLEPYNWPNLGLTLSLGIYPALALATEKALAKGWITNRTGCVIYFINLSILLFLPAGVIYYLHPIIVFSLFTLGSVTICFLKLISYGHVNYWCREHLANNRRRRNSSGGSPTGTETSPINTHKEDQQVYPANLTVKDLAYFLFAPTLCYELNFPRSARIRKRFLAKRIIEMMFLSWLLVALMQQWIVPVVNNARQPLAEMEIFKMLERMLKLSIPNHFIYLVFFYWLFHSTLNVVAELLRFGDREFYKDWWNAETVAEFWQNWNIPVHRFAARHVYKPLLKRGLSRMAASTTVFLLSAFFHEYLVSVPLRMFKVWAFMGMLMQVPAAYITGKYVRGKSGNIIMWMSLVLGQPVIILAYFHDYYIVHSLPLTLNDTASVTGS